MMELKTVSGGKVTLLGFASSDKSLIWVTWESHSAGLIKNFMSTSAIRGGLKAVMEALGHDGVIRVPVTSEAQARKIIPDFRGPKPTA